MTLSVTDPSLPINSTITVNLFRKENQRPDLPSDARVGEAIILRKLYISDFGGKPQLNGGDSSNWSSVHCRQSDRAELTLIYPGAHNNPTRKFPLDQIEKDELANLHKWYQAQLEDRNAAPTAVAPTATRKETFIKDLKADVIFDTVVEVSSDF